MTKNNTTRQEKFEDYRNSINRSDNEKNNQIHKEERKAKLNDLIIYFKKKEKRKLIIYYSILALCIIIGIILLVYFGVNYL